MDLKKFLKSKKLKIQFHGYVINDLNSEKIIGTFNKKELQKTNQQKFKIEKVTERKANELYVKGKVIIIQVIAGLIKVMLNEIPMYKNESTLS